MIFLSRERLCVNGLVNTGQKSHFGFWSRHSYPYQNETGTKSDQRPAKSASSFYRPPPHALRTPLPIVLFLQCDSLSVSERIVGRLFFLTTLQLDDQGVRIAEDAVHYRIKSEATEAVGIDKTFLGVHSSRYTDSSTPKT